jgi:uncharacterized protein (TIGR00369 family)
MSTKVQINPTTQLANLGEELNIPFLKLLGVRLISAEMGKGEILLALKPEHTNTWNVAHGGVLLTLMDVAMAVAARSGDPHDRGVVTIEMKNNFMQAAIGVLRVKAQTVRRTATMAFCEAKLYNDQAEVCCMAIGTFKYMKRLPAKDEAGNTVINEDLPQ